MTLPVVTTSLPLFPTMTTVISRLLLAVPAAAFLKVVLEDYYKGSRFYREG